MNHWLPFHFTFSNLIKVIFHMGRKLKINDFRKMFD